MRFFLACLFMLAAIAPAQVTLVNPDGTSTARTPRSRPRMYFDDYASLADPDGTSSGKNARLCANGSTTCSLANETIWAQAARAYLNNTSNGCNGTYDRTGSCAAYAALLWWMDRSGVIAGSGADTGKRYIDYVLEAIRDFDGRSMPLRGVIDRSIPNFGVNSLPPTVSSDYLSSEVWGWAWAYDIARTYTVQVYDEAPLSAGDIETFANATLSGAMYDIEASGTTADTRLTPVTGTITTTSGSATIVGSGGIDFTALGAGTMLYLQVRAKLNNGLVVECDPYYGNTPSADCNTTGRGGIFLKIKTVTDATHAVIYADTEDKYIQYAAVSGGVITYPNSDGDGGFNGTWDVVSRVVDRVAGHSGSLHSAMMHNTIPGVVDDRYRCFLTNSINTTQTTIEVRNCTNQTNPRYLMANAPTPPARPNCPTRFPFYFTLATSNKTTEVVKIVSATGTCPSQTFTVERAVQGTMGTAVGAGTELAIAYTNGSNWDAWNNQDMTRMDALLSLSLSLYGDDARAATILERVGNFSIEYGINPFFRRYNTYFGPAFNDYGRSRTDKFLARQLAIFKHSFTTSLDFTGDWTKRLFSLGYIYAKSPASARDQFRFGNQGGTCVDMVNPSCLSGPVMMQGLHPGTTEAGYAAYHLNSAAFTVAELDGYPGTDILPWALLYSIPTGSDYSTALAGGVVGNQTELPHSDRLLSFSFAGGFASNSTRWMLAATSPISDKLWNSGVNGSLQVRSASNYWLGESKLGASYGVHGAAWNQPLAGKIVSAGGVAASSAQFRYPVYLGGDKFRSDTGGAVNNNVGVTVTGKGHADYLAVKVNGIKNYEPGFHGISGSDYSVRNLIAIKTSANWVTSFALIVDEFDGFTSNHRFQQNWHFPQNNESTYAFRTEGKTVMASDGSGLTSQNAGASAFLHGKFLAKDYASDISVEVTVPGSTAVASVMTIGGDCTATAPCRTSFGGSTYSITSSTTVTGVVTASNAMFVWITSGGQLQATATNATPTCSNANVECVAWGGSFPASSRLLYTFARGANGTPEPYCADQNMFSSASGAGAPVSQCLGLTAETNEGTLVEGSRHVVVRSADGTGGDVVTSFETSSSGTPATVTDISTSNWYVAQAATSTPAIAAVSKDNTLRNGTDSFTSTHSGTGQYVVSGLNPGSYSVRLATVEQSTCTVATNENTCAWTGTSGAWQVVYLGALAVNITTTSLPSGSQSVAYSQTLSCEGGDGTYTWGVTAGALPPGLSLDTNTGLISGTPIGSGTSNFTAECDDGVETPATKALSIVIAAVSAPSITTPSLPAGINGEACAGTVAATGGVPPYAWSATGLPTGCTINASTGALEGTHSATGDFTASVEVEDSTSGTPQTATRDFTVPVTAAATPISITAGSLAPGAVGVAYSDTVTATGGDGTLVRSLVAGELCDGLSLASNGVVSGTVLVPDQCTFTVRVTDGVQEGATQEYTLTFLPSTSTLEVTALAASNGIILRYGMSGLDANSTCSWRQETQAGSPIITKADSGGVARRTMTFAANSSTAYQFWGACGTNGTSASIPITTPSAASNRSVRWQGTPPSGWGITHVRLRYGGTAGLGSTSAVTATGTPITFTRDSGILYLAHDWCANDDCSTVVAAGTAEKYVIQ